MGSLAANCEFTVLSAQRDAWLVECEVLRRTLAGVQGQILLEFSIPRMGRRIDAVLLLGPIVFAIEFKVGESIFHLAASEQVWDYALDLKNFHEASHTVPIVPILVATNAPVSASVVDLHADPDNVYRPMRTGSAGLRGIIDRAVVRISGTAIDAPAWARSSYRPTPTIVEAARALYAHHSVEAIARFDAGAENLRLTSRRIDDIVDRAVVERQKVVCFVTGVPGSGKTLVGLNVATRHRREVEELTHAVFLSGNGPLVAVLREALTRDEVARRASEGQKVRKGVVGESVKAFIQNVHHFRDASLSDEEPPIEHVVIFDEAQRAWNLKQTANFMKRKKNRPGFAQSEPEFLISVLDRHRDWAVIICLVGGGQEINTGEAGISAWLDAIHTGFPGWQLFISSRLTDTEYAAGMAIDRLRQLDNVHFDDSLHLAVSMRSFRAEHVSAFVKALLDCERDGARAYFGQLAGRYPIALTRDLSRAKVWIRARARGSERFGLVASSKAMRLKPHAIDIRVDVDPVKWFLNDRGDTRSSFFLEDAATEFQVQGLELDWTCVTWDGDLRFTDSGWSYHDFRGSRWCNVASQENRQYLLNAYRVLLTRARQGMVIFVPPGDASDPTRSPEFYDATFEYLSSLGLERIE
ncbi:MAG: DUF2075 domain-containing protein [Mycobacterium sp.]